MPVRFTSPHVRSSHRPPHIIDAALVLAPLRLPHFVINHTLTKWHGVLRDFKRYDADPFHSVQCLFTCAHRLQRSPTPTRSISSNASWETAPSRSHSPAQEEQLPAVTEADEGTMKTPQKPVVAAMASQLPQPSTATPARTPKNRTPIKPTGVEMHPAHHHASTAKVLDEARWLGFQALGAHTAPPKPTGLGVGQDTPTKATPGKVSEEGVKSPDARFRFRFKSPLGALSPSSSRILKDSVQETEGRGLFKTTGFTAPVDMTPKRKTVVPKGKMQRFSDAHMVRKTNCTVW